MGEAGSLGGGTGGSGGAIEVPLARESLEGGSGGSLYDRVDEEERRRPSDDRRRGSSLDAIDEVREGCRSEDSRDMVCGMEGCG